MSIVRTLLRRLVPRRFRPGAILKRWLDEKTVNGSLVVGGPFKGLTLGPESYYSQIYSKLLGIYEKEIHEFVEKIVALEPALIIDIGAAEGYYACGFSSRLNQKTKIVAYEADVHYRYYLKQNLRKNDLQSYVEVRGLCQVADLRHEIQTAQGPVVVFCDAEGWEHELLDNKAIPELSKASILVELHEFYLHEITEQLQRQFRETHKIEKVRSAVRTIDDINLQGKGIALRLFPETTVSIFLKERPFPQEWLWMEPTVVNESSAAFAALTDAPHRSEEVADQRVYSHYDHV
jgi:predicted O-methyltransferase YrrM